MTITTTQPVIQASEMQLPLTYIDEEITAEMISDDALRKIHQLGQVLEETRAEGSKALHELITQTCGFQVSQASPLERVNPVSCVSYFLTRIELGVIEAITTDPSAISLAKWTGNQFSGDLCFLYIEINFNSLGNRSYHIIAPQTEGLSDKIITFVNQFGVNLNADEFATEPNPIDRSLIQTQLMINDYSTVKAR